MAEMTPLTVWCAARKPIQFGVLLRSSAGG
jgi:hypothetical protein